MGWIKVDRKILENSIWEDRPFNRGAAWIDLLLLANHETTKGMYRGRFVLFQKGDVNRSIEWLAKRWGWSRKKVTRFLDVLELDGMVTRKSTSEGTTITLVNWALYQSQGTAKGTPKAHQKNIQGTSKEHIQEEYKEGYKKDKEEGANAPTSDEEEYEDDWEWEDP